MKLMSIFNRKTEHRALFPQIFQQARIGDINAILSVARCYEKGLGTRQCYHRALYWYTLAGRKGCVQGSLAAARLHHYGFVSNPNLATALEHYERAEQTMRRAVQSGTQQPYTQNAA